MAEDQNLPDTAWRIQADTVHGMTARSYRKSLIFETPPIRRFLDNPTPTQFIISAPKGFGKSLLLIAKSKQVEESQGASSIIYGSGGHLIDRPFGGFNSPSTTDREIMKSDFQFWRNIWRTCIMAACVKFNSARQGLELKLGELKCHPDLEDMILDRKHYSSTCDFFIQIMSFSANTQREITETIGKYSHIFLQ